MDDNGIWFESWPGLPAAWQGWALILVYLAGLALMFVGFKPGHLLAFLTLAAFGTWGLVVLCLRHTRRA